MNYLWSQRLKPYKGGCDAILTPAVACLIFPLNEKLLSEPYRVFSSKPKWWFWAGRPVSCKLDIAKCGKTVFLVRQVWTFYLCEVCVGLARLLLEAGLAAGTQLYLLGLDQPPSLSQSLWAMSRTMAGNVTCCHQLWANLAAGQVATLIRVS